MRWVSSWEEKEETCWARPTFCERADWTALLDVRVDG